MTDQIIANDVFRGFVRIFGRQMRLIGKRYHDCPRRPVHYSATKTKEDETIYPPIVLIVEEDDQ